MTYTIKGNYEGYIWYSDSTSPEVKHPNVQTDLALDDSKNPFIVEGELWDSVNHESVSIRFVDGHYIVRPFTVAEADLNGSETATIKSYLAQRMPGITRLKYLQYWKPIPDPWCEGMKALQPSDLVFIGFEK